MAKDEIFIQVKPAKAANMIIFMLKKAGCQITGEGSFVAEDGKSMRDIWIKPPPGMHPDEYGRLPGHDL